MNCRHCRTPLKLQFVDLGTAPPSNAYLTSSDLSKPEVCYPLRVMVCTECWLVQTEDYAGADEIFKDDYAYFSSYSSTWLQHAERYVARMVERFKLDFSSLVVELAANDGYLLQYVAAREVSCVGVEPTASTAKKARERGISIIQKFFGVELAEEMVRDSMSADLVVANNVLAHVPDINDFLGGVAALLKPNGVATFEFPHLLNLVAKNQFDTIYHEHYSYLSLTALEGILEAAGLVVFDVEQIPTHGGSLRVFAQRDGGPHQASGVVEDLLACERRQGVTTPSYYESFQASADNTKNDFLNFLLGARHEHKKVAAYGAAAKGNTLINYAGVGPDLLPYAADKNSAKQGKFLPGSRIPIVSVEQIRSDQPDYIVVLPWNIEDEVVEELSFARDWSVRFVTAVPRLRII